MSKVYSEELQESDFVQTVFLVVSKQTKTSRDGHNYLALVLQDRTGAVTARVWDDVESIGSRFEKDDFIAVRGEVERFHGELVLNIHDAEIMEESDIDLADFFAHSRWKAEDLYAQLCTLIESNVRSDALRELLMLILQDRPIRAALMQAPAAMKNHHAYRAGLLEHCLSMARAGVHLSEHYARYYPGLVNVDLVVAGCVLHDIGKCIELDFQRDTTYSTDGRLVGHIAIGAGWVEEYAKRCPTPIPSDLVLQLKHLVLSHHGQLEYGSPVVPQTAEAILLHHIDMIDSRLNLCWNLRNDTESQGGEYWTKYSRSLGGSLHVRGKSSWEDNPEFAQDDLLGPGVAKPDAVAQQPPVNLDLFERTDS